MRARRRGRTRALNREQSWLGKRRVLEEACQPRPFRLNGAYFRSRNNIDAFFMVGRRPQGAALSESETSPTG